MHTILPALSSHIFYLCIYSRIYIYVCGVYTLRLARSGKGIVIGSPADIAVLYSTDIQSSHGNLANLLLGNGLRPWCAVRGGGKGGGCKLRRRWYSARKREEI